MPALVAPAKQRSQRRQIITSLYPRIQDFLSKNYSHERVVELIRSETGIEFKVKTLKKYLYEERLNRGEHRSPRGRRSRSSSGKARPKAALPSANSPDLDANLEPEPVKAATTTAVKASEAKPKAARSAPSNASRVQTPETEDDLTPEPEFNTILRS